MPYRTCPTCHTAIAWGEECWYCAARKKKDLKKNRPGESGRFERCPQCGEQTLQRTNGCYTCFSCGYSKCDY